MTGVQTCALPIFQTQIRPRPLAEENPQPAAGRRRDLAEETMSARVAVDRGRVGEGDRADRSIRDHMNIIQAIELRDTGRAEALVRDHALGLAEHVARHADYLD